MNPIHNTDLPDTPCLLIEKSILAANIERMQKLADRHGLRLRPHIKTHKIPEIAHMQLKAGASGIAVAKLGEAEIMAENGINDIQIANQVVGRSKIERLKTLSRKVEVSCAVDSPAHTAVLSAAFGSASKPLPVFIEVDCGLGRCGVRTAQQAVALAESIRSSPGLTLRGLLTHAGHAYGAGSPEEGAAIGAEEGRSVAAMADVLRKGGFDVEVVSVGSTPTAPHCAAVPGVTELRVGNYVFYDAVQVALGSAGFADCALSVLATVISVPGPGRAIIDAGSKALGLDRGAQGSTVLAGHGRIAGKPAEIVRLSEEHGFLETAEASFEIGEQVRIVPNHACSVINLFDFVWLVGDTGVDARWRVAARGQSA
jgi:D-serine deaminase-like pyridoxal phosphate-dependent protein